MKNRRVVVTGIGTICCNGVGKDIFWKSVKEGVSNIDRITSFDPSSLYSQVAGEARDFNPADFMDSKEAKRIGRFNHFSLSAAKMALEDAHLTVTDDISTSTGVLIGSCF